MIKLKFDSNIDKMEMYRDKNIITAFTSSEYRDLINEIKRMAEKISPKTVRKNERKAEREALIRQLKIMLAIRWIDFKRFIVSKFKEIFKIK